MKLIYPFEGPCADCPETNPEASCRTMTFVDGLSWFPISKCRHLTPSFWAKSLLTKWLWIVSADAPDMTPTKRLRIMEGHRGILLVSEEQAKAANKLTSMGSTLIKLFIGGAIGVWLERTWR